VNQACVHCGADCGNHPIIWNEKAFCCNGCRTVYEILNQNKLFEYYDLSQNPGIKIEEPEISSKFSYLDHQDIRNKLIEFSDDTISRITLYIPAIHCSSCIWLLENLQQLHKAVVQSSVHFIKKEVSITFREKELSLRQLVEMLVSVHYVPLITLESVEKTKQSSVNKQLLYKIGVAGFCFGNTMLVSMPEYVRGSFDIDEHFKLFFGAINFILALPVFFYSSSDYIISAYKNIKHKILNIDLPIAIGIIAIFVESSYEIISQTGAGYMDSLCGLVFFLLIGKWYQNQTYQAISFDRDYRSYFPVAVTLLENNIEKNIPIRDLAINDHVLIRNNELIPADCILVSPKANIDYSFVTGESETVEKQANEQLFAGGKQKGSAIEVIISKKVEQSKLTLLWNNSQNENSNNKATPIAHLIDMIGRNFTFAVLLISMVTLIYWLFVDKSVALIAFTSVLIVACPCALSLSMPFAFGNTMRLFGNAGLYLKKAGVVEKLANFTTIVFDKTGTITHSNQQKCSFEGIELTPNEILLVKSLTRHSSHPLSIIIYNLYPDIQPIEVDDYEEYPAQGISGTIDGKVIRMGSESFIRGSKSNENITASTVYLSINNQEKGFFKILPAYRAQLEQLIKKLVLSGKDIHLISGDNDSEKANLIHLFPNEKLLHFNQSPDDKLNYIRTLTQQGKKVLMIGDGLNDAGALRESYTGITIADDIYHFTPACDAILKADKFSLLHEFIQYSHWSLKVVRMSLVLSFMYNFIGLYFAVSGQLSPIIAAILMPASSITVVGFVTLFTSLRKNMLKTNVKD